MSLAERINTFQEYSISPYFNSKPGFELLKSQVQSFVSIDNLALIMQENPRLAKNEIRRACNMAFENKCWDSTSDTTREELIIQIINNVFGLGPLEDLISDEDITEVMVNGPSSVFYEKGGVIYPHHLKFSNDEQIRALIDRILGPLGRRIDESSPMVNARLKQGHRVNAIIPPLSLVGSVLTIRKFSKNVITLEDMVASGSIEEKLKIFFEWAILVRKNIAVSGGTGSGKTTLLNAMSCKIPHKERIITIEDSAELRFLEHPHVVKLEARPRNAEGKGEVTIRDLVINALRMRPDRIVVGECRGGEALDMLQAMTTGHDGSLTTLHANSPAEVISRLSTMVRYVADLPVDVIEIYIASAFDLVVQTARSINGFRYVSEIVEFSYNHSNRNLKLCPIYKRKEFDYAGKWISKPTLIDELIERKFINKQEASKWLSI